MRNLKTMGLALVAIFAMSAMGAAAAQAEPAVFTGHENTTTVDAVADGSQDFNITNSGKKVTCETLDGHAEYENETDALTGTEVGFTECDTVILGFIHFSTTVVPEEGCHFTFTAGTWTGEDAEGSVHTCEVTINQYTSESHEALYCQQHVPAQTVELTYTNAKYPGDNIDTVTAHVEGEVEVTVTDLDNTGCNSHEERLAHYEGAMWAFGTDKEGEHTGTTIGPES